MSSTNNHQAAQQPPQQPPQNQQQKASTTDRVIDSKYISCCFCFFDILFFFVVVRWACVWCYFISLPFTGSVPQLGLALSSSSLFSRNSAPLTHVAYITTLTQRGYVLHSIEWPSLPPLAFGGYQNWIKFACLTKCVCACECVQCVICHPQQSKSGWRREWNVFNIAFELCPGWTRWSVNASSRQSCWLAVFGDVNML